MKKVTVGKVKKPYDILIGKGALNELGTVLKSVTKANKAVVITDENVSKLYLDKTVDILKEAGFEVLTFVFGGGEKNKTMATVTDIVEFMAQNNVSRTDAVVALGGGITGDVAGFCASVYLRGIDFVGVPTTFLAAIDSSVGGKTGVNLTSGKNLAGAFHQPRAVICDTDTFQTLGDEVFKDGIAEAIKYGVICDKELFKVLSQTKDWNVEDVIERCVSIKTDIVAEDELDTGKRQLLNLGHTIGHAIEKCTDFNITHGMAVAIGMAMIARFSERKGWAKKGTALEIETALQNNGLKTECTMDKKNLLDAINKDKKRKGDTITLAIPQETGKTVLKKIGIGEFLCDFV